MLIAGSDGKIDENERKWAKKLTRIRSYASKELLNEYYSEVGKDFSTRLETMMNELPNDQGDREKELKRLLAELNPILSKIRPKYGAALYESFVSFAKHVAKSSGGFLGFGSISSTEKKLIGLNMLSPIIYVEDEEE